MSTTAIALIAAAVALIAVIVAASRSGPRVTTIETRRGSDDEEDSKS